jgi:hypothetical protein
MIHFLFIHSETISGDERSQVLSVNWTILSPEGVLTLLELTCRLLAKVRIFLASIYSSLFIEIQLDNFQVLPHIIT